MAQFYDIHYTYFSAIIVGFCGRFFSFLFFVFLVVMGFFVFPVGEKRNSLLDLGAFGSYWLPISCRWYLSCKGSLEIIESQFPLCKDGKLRHIGKGICLESLK